MLTLDKKVLLQSGLSPMQEPDIYKTPAALGLRRETEQSPDIECMKYKFNAFCVVVMASLSIPVMAAPVASPTNLSATALSATQVRLGWTDNNAGTSTYRVYRNGITGSLAVVNGTSYSDNTATASTRYAYQIRAIDNADSSNTTVLSNFPAVTTPAASTTTVVQAVPPKLPTNLAAIATSATQIKLSWSDNNAGTSTYRVYRNGITGPLAAVTGSSYSDTTVFANTGYTYQIRALETANSANSSGLSTFPSVYTPAANSTIIFASDFEGGNLNGWGKELAAVSYAAQIVDAPAPIRSGAKALRIELHQDDPDASGSRRAELTRGGDSQNGEYWFAFSVFLPKDYVIDRSPEILAQWHNYPDFVLGETWMSPPLSLQTSNGKWLINRLWDDATVSSNLSIAAKGFRRLHDLGLYAADVDRWTDWVFRIKWGWQASQDPKLEVYKNGVMVLNQNGQPNTTNDVTAPYFKMGIYKWDWKQDPARSDLTTRVVYYDRVLIGDKNSTLRDMQ